jgi:peptidoglycan/LPS O-acetylase OafA/YrhL
LIVTGAIVVLWSLRIALQLGGTPDAYIYTAFETRVDQLLVGCLLAIVLHAGLAGGVIRALTSSAVLPWITVAVLAGVLWLAQKLGVEFRNTVGFCAAPSLVAILLLQLIGAKRSWSIRWLDSRALVSLGLISYSVYLYQQLLLHVVKRGLPAALPAPAALALAVASVIAAASLSYFVVETPFNNLKDRLSRRLSRARSPTVGSEAGPSARR